MDPTQISLFPVYTNSSAIISDCLSYRYLLRRIWDDSLPPLVAGLLNPSTADAETDDATITRLVRRARHIGCGSVVVWNLCAFRSTEPKLLAHVPDSVGPQNLYWVSSAIRDAISRKGSIMVGWGSHNVPSGILRQVRGLIETSNASLLCLGVTKTGHPRHPLYISYETKFQPWDFTKLAISEC